MQHHDMFSVIAASEDARSSKVGNSRAKIASVARVEQKFAKYVNKEAGAEEDKIDFLKHDILSTVVAACAEHGVTSKEGVQTALDAALGALRAAKENGMSAGAQKAYECARSDNGESEVRSTLLGYADGFDEGIHDGEDMEFNKGHVLEAMEYIDSRESSAKTAWNFDKKKDKGDKEDSDEDSGSDSDDKDDKPKKKGKNPFADDKNEDGDDNPFTDKGDKKSAKTAGGDPHDAMREEMTRGYMSEVGMDRDAAEMHAEQEMGALHEGDVCPVCHPDRPWEDHGEDEHPRGGYTGNEGESAADFEQRYLEDMSNNRHASPKTADGPATGDTYTQETVSLPNSKGDGATGLGSEFIENGTATSADVPSKAHPSEMQAVRPDNADTLKADPDLVSDTGKQVNPDTAIGEEQVGDRTDTFSTPEGQASAVTSRWRVEG